MGLIAGRYRLQPPSGAASVGLSARDVVSGDPVTVARDAVLEAKRQGAGVVIVDTAGRTNVDDVLMQQAADIKAAIDPVETLFVIDSMIGQEAVTVAKAFQEAVDFTGVILSKLDGDARGGAALSVAEVTARPIKFASIGEKLARMRRRWSREGDEEEGVPQLVQAALDNLRHVATKRLEADADAETRIVEILARAAQEIRGS